MPITNLLETLPDELLIGIITHLIGEEFNEDHHALQTLYDDYFSWNQQLTQVYQMWRDWKRPHMIDYIELANRIIPLCSVNTSLRRKIQTDEVFINFWKSYFKSSVNMIQFMVSAPEKYNLPQYKTFELEGIACLNIPVSSNYSNLKAFKKIKKRVAYFYSLEAQLLDQFCSLLYSICGLNVINEIENFTICYSNKEMVNQMLRIVDERFPNLTSLNIVKLGCETNQETTIESVTEGTTFKCLKKLNCPSLGCKIFVDKFSDQLEEAAIEDVQLLHRLKVLRGAGLYKLDYFSNFSKSWCRKFEDTFDEIHENIYCLAIPSPNPQALDFMLSHHYFSNVRELYINYFYGDLTLGSNLCFPNLEILSSYTGQIVLDGAIMPKLWKIGNSNPGAVSATEKQGKLDNLKELTAEINEDFCEKLPNIENICVSSSGRLGFKELQHLKAVKSSQCTGITIENCPSLEYVHLSSNATSLKIINQKRIERVLFAKDYPQTDVFIELDCEHCEYLELESMARVYSWNVKTIGQMNVLFSDGLYNSLKGKLCNTCVEELNFVVWDSFNDIQSGIAEKILCLVEELKQVRVVEIKYSNHMEPCRFTATFCSDTRSIRSQVLEFFEKEIINAYHMNGTIASIEEGSILSVRHPNIETIEIYHEKSMILLSDLLNLQKLSCFSGGSLSFNLSIDWYSMKRLKQIILTSAIIFKHTIISKHGMEEYEQLITDKENYEVLNLNMLEQLEHVEVCNSPHIEISAHGQLDHLKYIKITNNEQLKINFDIHLPLLRTCIIQSNGVSIEDSSLHIEDYSRVIIKSIQPELSKP